MRRALTIAVLLLALLAPAAHAGGRLIRVGTELAAGPVIGGDSLVWAGRDRHGWFVERIAPDGARWRERLRGPRAYDVALAADAGRTAVGLFDSYCPDASGWRCKYGRGWRTSLGAIYLDDGAGGFRRVAGCDTRRTCRTCPDEFLSPLHVELDGDALAESRPCTGAVAVTNLASGGTRRYAVDSRNADELPDLWSLAGSYVAFAEPFIPGAGPSVAVREWRTGELAYRFAAEPTAIELRADGVAFFPDGVHVRRASPEDPTPREAFRRPDVAYMRLAGDRLAFLTSDADKDRVEVARLDGSEPLSTPAPGFDVAWATEALDFDGRRAAWASRPCASYFVVEWDLNDQAPAPPQARHCPRPALVRRKLTVNDRGRFALALRCGRHALGCEGSVSTHVRLRHRWRWTHDLRFYSLDAGDRVAYRFELPRRLACRLRSRARARATLSVEGPAVGDHYRYRLPFTLRKVHRGCHRSRGSGVS